MQYCYVQNNQILNGPILLPKTWNNITNFHLMDNESLISYGWLPHTFIETATPGKIIEGSTFEIFSDKVVETQVCRDPTPAELEEKIAYQWKLTRAYRNYALAMCDWTQLQDNGLTEQQKNEWASYRQQLRDLPSTANSPEDLVFPADPTGFIFNKNYMPSEALRYYLRYDG